MERKVITIEQEVVIWECENGHTLRQSIDPGKCRECSRKEREEKLKRGAEFLNENNFSALGGQCCENCEHSDKEKSGFYGDTIYCTWKEKVRIHVYNLGLCKKFKEKKNEDM